VIHASLFLDVIQAERQLELERWQLVRNAWSVSRAAPGVGRLTRLRSTLDPRRWLARSAPTTITSDEHAAMSAACC
jgi:hypothetical protein